MSRYLTWRLPDRHFSKVHVLGDAGTGEKLRAAGFDRPFHSLDDGIRDYVQSLQ